MHPRKSLEQQITRWTRVISLVGLAGLLTLSAITVFEVLVRWLFSFPIQGVYDISQLVVIIVIAACFPVVSAERRHIAVRLTDSLLSARVNSILEAFGELVSLLIFGLMTWQLWIYSNELAASNQTTWMLLWPVAPWWRVATVLMAFCFPIHVLNIISLLKASFSGNENTQTANPN